MRKVDRLGNLSICLVKSLTGFGHCDFEEVTALDAHIRLAGELANEVDDGLPADRRCAMICFLD